MAEIRRNEDEIKKKAKRLYQIVKSGRQPKLNLRCCDYPFLEAQMLNFGTASQKFVQEAAASKLDTEIDE